MGKKIPYIFIVKKKICTIFLSLYRAAFLRKNSAYVMQSLSKSASSKIMSNIYLGTFSPYKGKSAQEEYLTKIMMSHFCSYFAWQIHFSVVRGYSFVM